MFLLLFLLFGINLINNRTNTAPKAYTPIDTTSVGIDNSYLFASPLTAEVGGEKIRINVYILNKQGIGLSGKIVSLGQVENLRIGAIQPTTDFLGKAVFDVSGFSPGVYLIEASVDGKVLPQRVSVTFK